MSRYDKSLPPSYFDALYESDGDPWRFATSDYERQKYGATLGALSRERYRSALEVGCSIGVLTKQLAQRCDTLVALDVAAAALDQARARCNSESHIRFEKRRVPAEWPAGTFDLILLSEVVYYLDRGDVECLADRVTSSLASGGDVVLVHWLGETHYPLSGDQAADLFIQRAAPALQMRSQSRSDHYRIDSLS